MGKEPQSELLGLDIQELTSLAQNAGEPDFRARQLYEALYRQRLTSVDQVSTLPQLFRRSLAEQFAFGLPRVERKFVSSDGTIRYLLAFADGQSVETVWMPEGDGGEAGDGTAAGDEEEGKRWDRATICVSSQVGCAVDCRFCLTATLGIQRNLTAGEIVGQVLAVLNDRQVRIGEDRINLVFMGQGEPFLNYDNFMKAVRLLVEGTGIPESRMTVSTSGIVPRIADLGQEAVRPKLAISLNASNDAVRERVMPINRKWPIAKLLDAARRFPLRTRERLTFEYVLLDGVNDSVEHARELAELLRGMRAKVNLIALNPGPGIDFGTPAEARVLAFQRTVVKAGIPAFIRRPRGRDIFAACGQLKKTVEDAPGSLVGITR
ncbi:MAG TPA: 23S rRNA (adenine(2503)-C(2))-methyltransferase RlmN [Terriglobales bacterium]|nr:23S rRNA (adenine(2503)-C(2))-methyltransferase RlmN [Terriglobales bacterium]